MRFTGGIVRRIGCSRYGRCLSRAAQIEGKQTAFSCGECDLFEPETQTRTAMLMENLRSARLLLEIWPELATADPAEHEGLNHSLDLPRFKGEAEEIMGRSFTMTATISC